MACTTVAAGFGDELIQKSKNEVKSGTNEEQYR